MPDHRWYFVHIKLGHFINEVAGVNNAWCVRSGLIGQHRSDLKVNLGDYNANNEITEGCALTYGYTCATNCSYSSWKLHLHVMHDFLPLFASAGHNSYLKYQQNMSFFWNPSVSMQSSWVAITWSVAVISILFLRQNIPLCDLWKQVWGWRWVAVCQIDDETYADGHCRRLWHRNLHFAMHCLVDRKYTTSEQYKSLKLLFTKTWLILIYSAKKSTVSSHAQLPRNAH